MSNQTKPMDQYLHPNELRRFNKLFELVDTLITAGDELADPATVARVSSSMQTEQSLQAAVTAIYAERKDWVALAQERARGDPAPDTDNRL